MAQTTTQKHKLPWNDDPRLGRYIDDNALFMLDAVSRGHFSGKHASNHFFIASLHPLEWDIKMLVKFLVRVVEEYGFELKNLATMTYAFAEEYEEPTFDEKGGKPFAGFEKKWSEYSKEYKKYEECRKIKGLRPDEIFSKDCRLPMPPRRYGGAYKWALDEVKKKSSEGTLFAKIFADKFDLADLEEVIKISDRMLPINEPEDSKYFYAKKIANNIVNWTSFEFVYDDKTAAKLQDDLNNYLEKFINNELTMPSREKRIGEVFILQNQNIYTFSRHKALMIERLREMHENFGNTFVFENPFEQIVPHDRDSKENLKQRYAARQFFFKHTIFAFEKLGYIRILSLGNNWHYSEEVEDFRDTTKIQLLPPFFRELGVEPKQTNLYFDDDKSRLFIRGTAVKIRKFSDQYHALRIIFANPKEVGQEWFFSEMAEKYDSEADLDDKKFYNAVYQVGQKVKTDGFPDFFITTRQSAKINPKYLS